MFLSTNQSRLIPGNNGDDHRKKVGDQKHAQLKHRLPEMSNFGRSRHLKVGVSDGDVNNKDYTFNST